LRKTGYYFNSEYGREIMKVTKVGNIIFTKDDVMEFHNFEMDLDESNQLDLQEQAKIMLEAFINKAESKIRDIWTKT